jgi:hypothetical protein
VLGFGEFLLAFTSWLLLNVSALSCVDKLWFDKLSMPLL